MDGASITLGAFLSCAVLFGTTAAALLPIVRREFLFWIVLRVIALTIAAVAMAPGLFSEEVFPFQERRLVTLISIDLSIALFGPILATYIENNLHMPRVRKIMRYLLPVSILPIAMVPSVVLFDRLHWLHHFTIAAMLVAVAVCLALAIRKGSRSAIYQSLAWGPAITLGFVVIGYELIADAPLPNLLQILLIALLIEFVWSAVGMIDGFMLIKHERDKAIADMYEAKLMTATDPLTGIANRRGLDQKFNDRTRKRPTGLALIDCDHFKQINDRFGHDVGDKVLVAIGRALSSEGAFAARTGGEEFVTLFFDGDWQIKAERTRRKITEAAQKAVPKLPVEVTASAGLSAVKPEDTLGSALKRADRALYAAKDAGRNRSMAFTEFRSPKGGRLTEVA